MITEEQFTVAAAYLWGLLCGWLIGAAYGVKLGRKDQAPPEK